MIHKLFHSRNRKMHGLDLRNVQVACRAIIKQAQPVDRLVALRARDDLCESCDATEAPSSSYSALFVREAQEHAPAQAAAA